MKKTILLVTLFMLSVGYLFAQETKERYTIKNLEVNNELSNFGTTYFNEDQVIYASPRKKSNIIKNIWIPNQQPFLDLFIGSVGEDGEIINSTKLNKEINTKYHESNVAFTNDMQTVYFTRDNYYKKDLRSDGVGMTHLAMFRADVVSPNVWSNIVELPFNDPNYSVGHPTLSEDNKTLYFSSDMPGAFGKEDIYKVSINEDGTYSNPENLGAKVNTAGQEMFPFMAEDNVLYFSSDGREGMGSLDIYAIKLGGELEAQNLGKPINSYRDDFSFTKKKGADYGYFSSNRGNGKGDDDIYYFKELEPIKLDCVQVADGVVTDKETGTLIPGAIVILYDANGSELDSQVVKDDAKFSFEIDCSSKYTVKGSKEEYTEDSKAFTSNADLKLGLGIDLGLNIEKIPPPEPELSETEYNQCQDALDLINNIYFDLDKSFIRPDAASELDKVIRIMSRCPNINVDATSHTDSRASFEYNEALSQRRAQATVDYIINTGNMAPERIKAIGYGETRLRNHCADGVRCSETEHQMNRRTQFEISNF